MSPRERVSAPGSVAPGSCRHLRREPPGPAQPDQRGSRRGDPAPDRALHGRRPPRVGPCSGKYNPGSKWGRGAKRHRAGRLAERRLALAGHQERLRGRLPRPREQRLDGRQELRPQEARGPIHECVGARQRHGDVLPQFQSGGARPGRTATARVSRPPRRIGGQHRRSYTTWTLTMGDDPSRSKSVASRTAPSGNTSPTRSLGRATITASAATSPASETTPPTPSVVAPILRTRSPRRTSAPACRSARSPASPCSSCNGMSGPRCRRRRPRPGVPCGTLRGKRQAGAVGLDVQGRQTDQVPQVADRAR